MRPELHRQSVLKISATAAFTALCVPPMRLLGVANAAVAPIITEQPAVVPLSLCGGAFCAAYTIDGQPFRAVVDTGSPFVLVDGTCSSEDLSTSKSAAMATVWGCYRGAGRPSGLSDTDELFGGQDVGVQWRRGAFVLTQARIDDQLRLTAAIDDAVFGVVRTYVGKGGGGAVFLGLAKRRLPRIRPTLLEQTDVASLHFDFIARRLELSRRPLIPRTADAMRIIDLRPAGAPVANYAVRVSRLAVNGVPVRLDRPLVAVIDTGTTGISVSDALFDSGLLPAQWRDARIEMPTERGGTCAIEASIRRRRKPSPGVPTIELPIDAPEFDEFPLIVSPVRVPWFEPGFGDSECADGEQVQCNGRPVGAPKPLLETLRFRAEGLGPEPHVIFVGLAFLWPRKLTIDVDAGRMSIV